MVGKPFSELKILVFSARNGNFELLNKYLEAPIIPALNGRTGNFEINTHLAVNPPRTTS
jgi:hypothetical protein